MLIPCKVGFLPLQPPSIFHWFPHLSTKIYKNGHRNKTYKRLRHPPPLIMTRSEVSDEGWVNYIFENLGEELLAGCQILTFNGQWHCLFFVSIQKFPLQALLRAKGLKLLALACCLVLPFAMFNFPSSKTWLQGWGKVGEARQSRNEPDIFFLWPTELEMSWLLHVPPSCLLPPFIFQVRNNVLANLAKEVTSN